MSMVAVVGLISLVFGVGAAMLLPNWVNRLIALVNVGVGAYALGLAIGRGW